MYLSKKVGKGGVKASAGEENCEAFDECELSEWDVCYSSVTCS